MSAVHSQNSSDAMIVIYVNIEALTSNKTYIISKLCKDKHFNTQSQRSSKGKQPGMALVTECPHKNHGSSVFVRDGLNVTSISVCKEDNVEFITVELPGVVVHSVSKPPTEQFLLPPLGSRNMPHIVTHSGDTPQLTTTEKR